ncbi:MAG: C40 family peptidase [bacterium]|nr:C40 family peptidase [bacterium]
MKKVFFLAMAGLLVALVLIPVVGGLFDHWLTETAADGRAAAQETPPAPESEPADLDEEPEPESEDPVEEPELPEDETLRLLIGPRSQPAVLEGTREQFQPARGMHALVFGEWSHGGWTDLLVEPRAGAARRSQVLIGDEVRVLDQKDESRWSQVELGGRDLRGWVRTEHLTEAPKDWKSGARHVVVRAPGVATAGGVFLPFGATLPLAPESSDSASPRLLLPDGRRILVEPEEVRSLDRPLALAEALILLRGFREVPYRRGGNTAQAMDSSGLIFLAFHVAGVSVPRELGDLWESGKSVYFDDARAGDVVFFSTFNPDQPRPVILLDERETFIEASQSSGVSLGWVEQLRNRTVLGVRRYG